MQIFHLKACVIKNECLLSKRHVNTSVRESSIKNKVFSKFCLPISLSKILTVHTSQILRTCILHLRLARTSALFPKEILSPDILALENSSQVLSEYQTAHLKSGSTTCQLLLKSLLCVKFSILSMENLHIHPALKFFIACWWPSEFHCLLTRKATEPLQAHQLSQLGRSTLSKHIQLKSSKHILYLSLILFNSVFLAFWITGDTLHHPSVLKRSGLKVTGKVTTFSYAINEYFDYNPNDILINVITTWSWKNLNGCIIRRLTLWLTDWKQRAASNNNTAAGKKAEGGSSCT